MQLVAEDLAREYKRAGIQIPYFHHSSSKINGFMRKHKILNKDLDQLSLAELLALFYVDDGAMIYSSR